MNAPCTVTPEKLRNLARIVALADKMDDLSQENLVVHLRAAADEIERLQTGVLELRDMAIELRDHIARGGRP